MKTEIKARNLGSMGVCRVGLEVHFKEAEGCYENQQAICRWCVICIHVGKENR